MKPDLVDLTTSSGTKGAYSPVVTSADGAVEVHLSDDHPGFSDPSYRQRRNDIARLSLDYVVGQPIPVVEYTDDEHRVWGLVASELATRHRERACAAFVAACEAVNLPVDHIPQLTEVTACLSGVTDFTYLPVAGLAPLRDFYGSFAERRFFSTQYLRHPSVPRYTPEPDIVHEVIGHANQLGDNGFASIYLEVGEAVARITSDAALGFLSQVFWFTMEFGVVLDNEEPKAYGAGILSSIGEMDVFQSATIRPLDIVAMGRETYDITHYQPVLYSLASMDELYGRVTEFFATYDDEAYERLCGRRAD